MINKFDVEEQEAYTMIRKYWSGLTVSSNFELIKHKLPDFWADIIFSDIDSHENIFLLMYKNTIVGFVTELDYEFPWNYGKFKYGVYGESFRDMFDTIVLEENFDETQYQSDLLNDQNWSLIIKTTRKQITMPAIHIDGTIAFRWSK